MKSFLLMTGSVTLVIITSHDSIESSPLLEKLRVKGIEKFIAFELPFELAKRRYGEHFKVASNDLYETDDLHVVDYDGHRIFMLFSFSELGQALFHEPGFVQQAAA